MACLFLWGRGGSSGVGSTSDLLAQSKVHTQQTDTGGVTKCCIDWFRVFSLVRFDLVWFDMASHQRMNYSQTNRGPAMQVIMKLTHVP